MYKINYHPLVWQDVKKIPRVWLERINFSIEGRLVTSPDIFGKPLRRPLQGYRKLRVGDYRVIFKIDKNLIRILLIQHRSVVYKQVGKRI